MRSLGARELEVMLFTPDVSVLAMKYPNLVLRFAAIWTGLGRNLDQKAIDAIGKTSAFWKNHDQGAATVLVAALDPALDGA